MRNIILISTLVLVSMNCDEIFNPDEPEDPITEQADTDGNIAIINNSDQKLVLYDAGTPVRIIPNMSEEFLVKIPNPSNVTKDLWLYKNSDVSSDYDNPVPESMFRRWNVKLSSDYEVEHRVSWVVYGVSEERESGTLMLSYNPGTEYNVDIFLSSQTGARIATLMPGQTGTNVGIDYGIYELYYYYWYSDQNTAGGIIEKGWTTPEDSPILTFILNDAFPETYRLVPHFDVIEEVTDGEILIQNNTESILVIKANSNLIENIMVYDGSTTMMSYLPGYSQYLYVLPEGDYNFLARDATTNDIVDDKEIIIVAGELYDWEINSE